MSTENYPKYRVSKDIEVKFAPPQGKINCSFHQIVRAFGRPPLSVDNNDSFEGTEQCQWNIQFETGHRAIIAESRAFGNTEQHYEKTTNWKVNSLEPRVFEWIKQIIRDSNPNA